MESQLVHEFVLRVKGKTVAVLPTFEEAQEAAAPYLNGDASLQISTSSSRVYSGPGPVGATPMQMWNYDRPLQQWIEHLR
jgi:hypothetical protein